MRAALPALVLIFLLAGCSDPSNPADDADDTTATDTPPMGTVVSDDTVSEPAADVELFNDTLDFTAPNGGSAGSKSLTQPAQHGNVSVTFQVYADCPSGYVAESPRLVLSAGGVETVLWEYDMVAPNEPYLCSPATGLMGRERGAGTVIVAVAPGPFKVETIGQFTGEVEVAVTATA